MTSVFDFDDSINTVYNAKTAGKNLVTAKHEVLTKAGDFLFLAHSDREFALRCQMMEADIESAARRKMATVSDSKFKLVRALHEEWKIRHANCTQCNVDDNLKVSSTVEAHAGQKDTTCDECGATLQEGGRADDVRGHLDICSKHLKKSSLKEKIASLKTRLAFPFELDKADQNRSVYSVTSQLGPKTTSDLISKYADRRADNPAVQGEAKAGRWAMIVKHDSAGKPIDATLGRIGGSQVGGDAEVSPLGCTGNTHHGSSNCTHEEGDAFGGRHIALQETPAMQYGESLFPRLTERKEASVFAPSHRVYILPQEHHDVIEKGLNEIATSGVSAPGINIPSFKREEEGRGKPVETFGRGHESENTGHGVNTEMGPSQNVGKVSNFTIWPDTADFGHHENQLATNRGKGEGTAEMLSSGPRDRNGSYSSNPNWGKVVPGQEGRAGTGRVLPIITMHPEYNKDDAKKGMSGSLGDGTPAGIGVTPRLRPVSWGNESDSPTFKFLQGSGKVKATGEALRQKLVGFNAERQERVGAERVQRAQTSPSPKAPTRSQVGTDVLNKLLGKE
jgi:hypothetical protein